MKLKPLALACLLFSIIALPALLRALPGAAEDAAPPKGGEKAETVKKEEAADPSVGGLPGDPKATGTITGVITLDGKAPELKPIPVAAENKDRPICGGEIPNERLILGPGNVVQNAVVSLAKVPGAPKPANRTLKLDNSHCRFVPHVQAATVGSSLKITSQDGILHSAMGLLTNTFNLAVSNPDQVVVTPLRKAGWVPIKCSVHTWMEAHIWVFPHDFFAVTGKDGKFRLTGVPPGKYELVVWQEALADYKREVTVEAGKTAEVSVALKTPE